MSVLIDRASKRLLAVLLLAVAALVVASHPAFADAASNGDQSGNIQVSVPTKVPTYVCSDGTVLAGHATIENKSSDDVTISDVTASDVSHYNAVSLEVSTGSGKSSSEWFSVNDEGLNGGDSKELPAHTSLETTWNVKTSSGKLNPRDNGSLLNAATNGPVSLAKITFTFTKREKQDFAVYSDDDHTLRFYRRSEVPEKGSTFNGHPVTHVIQDIDDHGNYLLGNDRSEVTSVEFVDKGIKPKTTNLWFCFMTSLESIKNLDWLDTSDTKGMSEMFRSCSKLTQLDLSGLNTSNVSSMRSLFNGCCSLNKLALPSNFVTSRVVDTSHMFQNCSQLTELDLSSFDTSNVTSMKSMFAGSGFKSLDLSHFDTSHVEDMSYMFQDCSSLECLNISGFDSASCSNSDYMFTGCGDEKLAIIIGDGWKFGCFPGYDDRAIFYDQEGKEYKNSNGIDPSKNTVYYKSKPSKQAVSGQASSEDGRGQTADPQYQSSSVDAKPEADSQQTDGGMGTATSTQSGSTVGVSPDSSVSNRDGDGSCSASNVAVTTTSS